MRARAQMMVCSGANGLGLALVIPATQSLIADLYPPETRGRAFGLLLLFSGLGEPAGALRDLCLYAAGCGMFRTSDESACTATAIEY